MKNYLLIIMATAVFMGCSQESSDNKKSEKETAVNKKSKRSAVKAQALTCHDEGDKVTCKLTVKRVNKEREVEFEWKSPNGKDDREREVMLPENHSSIFDVRYKKGRIKGKWEVEAEIDDAEYSTTFTIQ